MDKEKEITKLKKQIEHLEVMNEDFFETMFERGKIILNQRIFCVFELIVILLLGMVVLI